MYRQYLPRAFDYRDSSIETNATSGFLSPAQVSNHAMSRVRCSLTAGVDLALMKTCGMIPGDAQLVATGARVIDDKGQTRNPAAHALPCGISVAGKGPVHRFPKAFSMQEFVAQPYKYTNVVPLSANRADLRAEAFNRKDETGLVGCFRRFTQRILETSTATRGVLDRGPLQLEFIKLIKDYAEALAIALNNSEPQSSGRIVQTEFGTVVDPQVSYTDDQFHEDNVRTVLRGQIAAMKEFESSSFSIILLEQVESDFHENAEKSGG